MRTLALALALLAPVTGWGGEAVYLLRGARPVSVARNGYVQTAVPVGDGWVRVEVATDPSPVGVRGGRVEAAPRDTWVPAGFVLPAALAGRLATAEGPWERATRALEWVMARVAYDAGDRGPQDAISVLGRRRGRCSGIANAAVGVLRAAGFPARPVSGLLIREGRAVPHRWLEVALPGAGWVPTDPTLGLWLVTAAHVACAGPVTAGVAVRVLSGPGRDLDAMPRRGPWPCRPDVGATLACRVARPVAGARAVLSGPAGQVLVARLERDVTFVRLLPGRWRVTLERNGRVVGRFGVDLAPGAARLLTLDAGASSG